MDPNLEWWITVLAAGGIPAGLALLARGLIDYRTTVRVGDTSTSTISSLAAGEVRVSGVVEPAEMTLVSLLQSAPCVYYRSTFGHGGEIAPLDSGSVEERSCGFRIRDPTGSIRVFPRGARVDAPVRFEDETGTSGDEPPWLAIRTGAATRVGEPDRATAIADRRELYNDQVYRYNTRIAQVPGVALAPVFGWRAREFFAATPEEAVRPDATLRSA